MFNKILFYLLKEMSFEYSKNKEVDKSAYREFEDVWREIKNNLLYT